jgi:hypothetical protein
MSTDNDARFSAMEKQISELTARLDNKTDSSDKKTKKKKSGEKRAPTAYNEFMKKHISEAKAGFSDTDGKFDHKKAFADAAAAWSKDKADKKKESSE